MITFALIVMSQFSYSNAERTVQPAPMVAQKPAPEEKASDVAPLPPDNSATKDDINELKKLFLDIKSEVASVKSSKEPFPKRDVAPAPAQKSKKKYTLMDINNKTYEGTDPGYLIDYVSEQNRKISERQSNTRVGVPVQAQPVIQTIQQQQIHPLMYEYQLSAPLYYGAPSSTGCVGGNCARMF